MAASCSTVEADLARSKALCTDVGYPPDTDQWRDCVLDLEVAWHHGRYRSFSSQEDQRRFCTDLGFTAGSDDHRFCMAEHLAAAAHSYAAGVLYNHRDRCKELGFVADTDAFRRCVVTFVVAPTASLVSRSAAAVSRAGAISIGSDVWQDSYNASQS